MEKFENSPTLMNSCDSEVLWLQIVETDVASCFKWWMDEDFKLNHVDSSSNRGLPRKEAWWNSAFLLLTIVIWCLLQLQNDGVWWQNQPKLVCFEIFSEKMQSEGMRIWEKLIFWSGFQLCARVSLTENVQYILCLVSLSLVSGSVITILLNGVIWSFC